MEEIAYVKSDLDAEEAIQQIRDIEEERNRLVETCMGRIETYQAVMKHEIDRAAERIARLEGALQCYFETVKPNVTKTQATYRLPTGKLKMKLAFQRMVPDTEALMSEYPAFVEQKPELRWGELKKRLDIAGDNVVDTETGAIVQGVSLETVPSKFIVEV